MCRNRTVILWVFLMISVGVLGTAASEVSKEITCTGKVVDEQDRPIGGAKVSLYHIVHDESTRSSDSKLAVETRTTADDGGFSFTATPEGDSQELDPEVLIDKYNSCNRRFQTIYYELETTLLRPDRKYVYSFKHCSNNDKAQWIGGLKCYETDGTINQNISTLFTDIYGDNWGLSLQYNPELHSTSPPKALMVHNSREKFLRSLRGRTTGGSPMTGRVDGSSDQSISALLKGASKMNVQAATKIMGFTTYLVEADTQYGSVKAWISPDAGYNCLKWEVIKRQNQFYRDGKLTHDDFTGWRACFTAHKLDSVDDQYFVTEAEFTEEVKKGETVLSNPTYRYSLTHINLHPDFEAMKAFEIQLPEGTVVTHEEVPGTQFRWTNGQFVPDVDDYLYKNLTGKPLPSLESLVKGLEQDYDRDKMFLVCFFDMNQRPSRNSIQQLSKRAQELKAKGVVVVAVQASKVDQSLLDEWVKKNNVPFPVGMVQGDTEKARFAWGVKSLPWLILTNRKCIVVSEEFGLGDLDNQLQHAGRGESADGP